MNKATHHKDMPMEEYQAATDAVSKSMLGKFADCPARYKHLYIDQAPEKQTKSLRKGSAVHTLALEPKLWKEGYHVMPATYYDKDGNKKPFKNDVRMQVVQDEYLAAGYEVEKNEETKKWEVKETPKSKVLLTQDEYESVQKMAEALTKNSLALSLLKSDGYVESSIFFEAEFENSLTGEMETVKMRCRPDLMRNDGLLVDLKGCRSAKPSLFWHDAFNLHYDLSVAITGMGYEALHGEAMDNYVFVAVEWDEPHIIECYESCQPMDELTGLTYAEYGRLKLNKLMGDYLACKSSNTWPGYQQEIGHMEIPQWALRQFIEKGI